MRVSVLGGMHVYVSVLGGHVCMHVHVPVLRECECQCWGYVHMCVNSGGNVCVRACVCAHMLGVGMRACVSSGQYARVCVSALGGHARMHVCVPVLGVCACVCVSSGGCVCSCACVCACTLGGKHVCVRVSVLGSMHMCVSVLGGACAHACVCASAEGCASACVRPGGARARLG